MYNSGLVAAVVLGLVALLPPVLWIGWWMVADLGDRVSGAPHPDAKSELRHAA
jgi:hypothetical protein